jgi:hypothetical protein
MPFTVARQEPLEVKTIRFDPRDQRFDGLRLDLPVLPTLESRRHDVAERS